MNPEIEHSENDKNMTVEETIFECGRLGYPIDRIIALLYYRITPEEKNQLVIDLQTPGSEAYKLYDSGKARGQFETMSGLKSAADRGDIDAAKILENIRREYEIEKSIKKSFG